ncbi:helix-turn-helix domain-containing protein [Deltaproteobacteria bacterium PRO3]|nr:helix-turn-helix domain-containing protein [Deltaproteobacteria bacterium PRO3]
MTTRKKSQAGKVLEKYTGGPLTLGRFLASIRKGEEMGLEEFGKLLGISKSHLSDIENGRKLVSAALAAQYAKKLGYSEKQFIRLTLQDSLNRQGLERYRVGIEAS